MDVGSLDWAETRLEIIRNKYMHYAKKAETEHITIREAAGRENLEGMLEEVEDISSYIAAYQKQYDRYNAIRNLAEVLGCELNEARHGH